MRCGGRWGIREVGRPLRVRCGGRWGIGEIELKPQNPKTPKPQNPKTPKPQPPTPKTYLLTPEI
ncbi:hypothetical protein EZJ55_03145 [Microcystis aeruginosa EAWAG127a]|uniref:Uncharacterized protein n=1 Tax=Microcystis aeruginosa EAWAG127a TaxID=2529855 RepID=A0A5J5LQC7_MICAE|nr:hypothetical protein EZJ55_03145 [Microcystis aeruginosa EAWAG127a]